MGEHRIAAIPGDGIGPEVLDAGLKALAVLEEREPGFKLHVETFPWGSDYYRRHGRMMPDDGIERLRAFDAIYFGAVGDPEVPDHVTLWGLRLAICQGFDQYANVRPARILPGVESPLAGVGEGDLDWVIVRENSEGENAGAGGRAGPRVDQPDRSELTDHQCGQLVVERHDLRFGFDIAQVHRLEHVEEAHELMATDDHGAEKRQRRVTDPHCGIAERRDRVPAQHDDGLTLLHDLILVDESVVVGVELGEVLFAAEEFFQRHVAVAVAVHAGEPLGRVTFRWTTCRWPN